MLQSISLPFRALAICSWSERSNSCQMQDFPIIHGAVMRGEQLALFQTPRANKVSGNGKAVGLTKFVASGKRARDAERA
jgi:hypothetical protein